VDHQVLTTVTDYAALTIGAALRAFTQTDILLSLTNAHDLGALFQTRAPLLLIPEPVLQVLFNRNRSPNPFPNQTYVNQPTNLAKPPYRNHLYTSNSDS
ncbi:Uncharacterized protein APZ42_005235, partial [Daphnia magna]